jgi:hypothetical protein
MKIYSVLSVVSVFLFSFQPFSLNKDYPSEKKLIHAELAQFPPLPNAFAHNDYWHPNPFWDALRKGFTFLEADVHLVNGQLLVAHTYPWITTDKKSLKELYLTPLYELFKANNGSILPLHCQPFRLMIDIKSNAEKTYQQLKKELKEFEEMLCSWQGTAANTGAVLIILSGNRPIKTIAAEKERFVCIDGRLNDLHKGYDPSLMPIISDRFSKICRRQLFGLNYSKGELKRIKYFTDAAHAEGKEIRFWRIPETTTTWKVLLNAKVDWINTDEIDAFSAFQREQHLPSSSPELLTSK